MAARPIHLTHKSLFLKLLPKLPFLSSLYSRSSFSSAAVLRLPLQSPRCAAFSTTSTPYPLQYDLIVNTPVLPRRTTRRHPTTPSAAADEGLDDTGSDENPAVEMEFDAWVEKKLSSGRPGSQDEGLDRSKRKYLRKREKRLYGSDSEDDRKGESGFVELKPRVVDFDRLHEREEELYFYDAFAYPWDKDKHYKMVYKLEKKFFPEHCLDKAFVDEKEYKEAMKGTKNASSRVKMNDGGEGGGGDRKFVFFDEDIAKEKGGKKSEGNEKEKDLVVEKKVEEFFKCLKKVPMDGDGGGDGEPYLITRSTELPPRWDGPNGTVILINKPKGWTSFTVCGKLRRLVKVKKVGHAGTLDPMATGLLIVCVGKATKLADEYQGMVKGYSGVFRLGEATSTLDADSPVTQREPWEHIKDADVKKNAASFVGEIWQVPPMFSAIKVNGEKMYEKARRGESIELSPRKITIFKFDIERSLEDRQNLIFRVTCSKGTYIRSLCADFGKALGSCAHLTALRRDSIGEYSADDAWEFNDLEDAITKGYF